MRVLNPIVRTLLRSPVGSRIRPLALLDFAGRRTGRRRRVVVAWHELDSRRFVVTPAGWRANFDGGASATVRHRGVSRTMIGTLESDPSKVARVLRQLFDAGSPPKSVGLAIEGGHVVTAHDVVAVRRAVVWFDP